MADWNLIFHICTSVFVGFFHFQDQIYVCIFCVRVKAVVNTFFFFLGGGGGAVKNYAENHVSHFHMKLIHDKHTVTGYVN